MAAPGLDEITTTTLRNRKMAKGSPKAALKTAQTGTEVPAKDFSSKKKETAAAGTGKPEKGSAAVAKALPTESANSATVAPVKKTWEGSSEDWSADYSAAKRRGISTEDHEDSARDRISDAAGDRKFAADESEKIQHVPEYKKGVSAYSNSPKASHGFGHPASARDGHLRNSGHSSAHRIGKK